LRLRRDDDQAEEDGNRWNAVQRTERAASLRRKSTMKRKLNCDLETIVLEYLILGAFLVLPLLIVAFLFSDELWQEHRMLAQQADDERPRRIDWRHPLRSMLHRH
jgi:hypothetical protein